MSDKGLSEEEFGQLLGLLSRMTDSAQLERLRESVQARTSRIRVGMLNKLRPGAEVRWSGKHGAQQGKVVRVKQKYVECRVLDGRIWNVPADMLSEVV